MTEKRRLPGWLANLLAVGGSLVVALLLAEGALRLFPGLLPESALLRLNWSQVRSEVLSLGDPYVGFRYPPNTTHEIDRGEIRFTYTTDEHGFRNASPWPQQADVVILGDSQVFGYGVDDDQAWVRLVDESLPDVGVMNLGLIGSSPEQYRRIYETVGARVDPKLVLFGLFPGNDLQGSRMFAEWEQAGSQGNFDVYRFFGSDIPASGRWLASLVQSSYLFQLVNETRRGLGASSAGRTIELAGGGRVRLAPATIEAAVRTARPDHPDFQRVMATIDATRATAAEHGAEMVVLLFPTKEEVYLPLEGESAISAIEPFIRALEEQGVPLLDLTPGLQAHADEQIFFEIDGHANAAGNRVIADIVREYLARHAAEYSLGDAGESGSSARPTG